MSDDHDHDLIMYKTHFRLPYQPNFLQNCNCNAHLTWNKEVFHDRSLQAQRRAIERVMDPLSPDRTHRDVKVVRSSVSAGSNLK